MVKSVFHTPLREDCETAKLTHAIIYIIIHLHVQPYFAIRTQKNERHKP